VLGGWLGGIAGVIVVLGTALVFIRLKNPEVSILLQQELSTHDPSI
jgi:hypothetical protein